MKWIKRKLDNLIVAAIVLAGGAFLGQFPQYLSQYMQRLGGHIDEAQLIVSKYNIDEIQQRLDYLNLSFSKVDESKGLNKLFSFIKYADKDIAERAFKYFTPGITFDSEGILFFLIGALLGFLLFEIIKDLVYYLYLFIRKKISRKKAEADTTIVA